MIFTPLASSSAGNAYILDDGRSKLLIECGIPYKRLQKLMGFGTSALCGCIVSHEHRDHAKCHMDLIKNGVPVYASKGTAAALGCDALSAFGKGEGDAYGPFQVASFDVLPFTTFHDAAEPCGYLVRSRVNGEKLVFATDTVSLAYTFSGPTWIAIECNYDEDILSRATHLPAKVVHRIRNSHMEVGRVCDFLRRQDLTQCRRIYLLHLSDACSNEGLMIGTVERACPGVEVVACHK